MLFFPFLFHLILTFRYNIDNVGTEGGLPGIHPAFGSGQDGFLASLETKGIMDETYYQALSFCQRSTREEGLDKALIHNSKKLSALLVPADVGQVSTCFPNYRRPRVLMTM